MTTNPERRGWHIAKEIPVALLLTLLVGFTGAVTFYNQIQTAVAQLNDSSKKTIDRLDNLSRTVQESSVPSALNGARISVLEAQVAEIKSRVYEMERRQRP